MARTWIRLMAVASLVTIATAAVPYNLLPRREPGYGASDSSSFGLLPPRAAPRAAEGSEILLGLIATMSRPEPPSQADGQKIAGAMTLAVEAVNSDPNLIPGYTLRYIVGDDRGTEETSIEVIKEQRDGGAVAFFGPEDTCKGAATLAGQWNLPILAYKCNDPSLSDKSVYPTFARTQPSATEAAQHLIALMGYYKWLKFSIFVELAEGFPYVGQWLKRMAESQGFVVNHYLNVSAPFSEVYDQPVLKKGIEETYQETRIYVVLGKISMVRSFVAELRELGLTDTGEYVVLGFVDNEPYTEDLAKELVFPGIQFKKQREKSHIASLENVLILSQAQTDRTYYLEWEADVTEELYNPPLNLPKNPYASMFNIKAEVPLSAAHLYEAVMVYAQALTKMISEGGNISDGRAILDHIKDSFYPSPLGHTGQMDSNGDALANYIMLGFQPFDDLGDSIMRPIGKFERNLDTPEQVVYEPTVAHFSGQVPVDEPVCGYSGQKCRDRRQDWQDDAGQFDN